MDHPARWAPGTTFVPTGDGWLVHAPDEDFMVVGVPDADRAVVADLIAGNTDVPAAVRAVPDAAGLVAELTATPDPVTVTDVLLTGDGMLVAPLTALLGAARFEVHHVAVPDPRRCDPAATVLVACADHPRDREWRELGARCRAAGIAWHRGHAEGRRWYAGPFTPPHGGACYEDVRLRRLAACPWPDELAAYWAYLDDGGRPAAPAGREGAAVAAAYIAADLRAWRQGAEPPGAGAQIGIDMATGGVRRHPVLPVPRDLMREVPA